MNDFNALTAREYQLRVEGLLERRRTFQARTLLGEALAAHPGDADLLYLAARAEYMGGRLDDAIATVRQVLAQEPTHLNARYLLVDLYEDRKELAQAEGVLLDILHDYPETGAFYARYALLMFRTFHIEKACALAREASRLDPDDDFVLTACMIGDLIAGNKSTQQRTMAELMHLHPQSQATAHMLIAHLAEHGQYWAAKRIAIEMLKAQPDSRDLLDRVVQLEALCHWTMLPLWPFNRWSMPAVIGFFLFTLLAYNMIGRYAPGYKGAWTTGMLAFMAYSWFYPPILTRWLKRRAGL